jgi:serine/threonine protein kinase
VGGKYRLQRRIGSGGMGEVWLADTPPDRPVAIKFMHAHSATSERARRRFIREAEISAQVRHGSIVDVFEVGELPDGPLYLVMELLEGVSLAEALEATPPLTAEELVSVMVDTSHALEAAHAAGIVHRDVKPANIFLHTDRVSGLAYANQGGMARVLSGEGAGERADAGARERLAGLIDGWCRLAGPGRSGGAVGWCERKAAEPLGGVEESGGAVGWRERKAAEPLGGVKGKRRSRRAA